MAGAWLNGGPPFFPPQLTGKCWQSCWGGEAAGAGLTQGSKGVSQIRLVNEAIPVLIHDGERLEAQEEGREHRERENRQPL